jgi:hypothetical protein
MKRYRKRHKASNRGDKDTDLRLGIEAMQTGMQGFGWMR